LGKKKELLLSNRIRTEGKNNKRGKAPKRSKPPYRTEKKPQKRKKLFQHRPTRNEPKNALRTKKQGKGKKGAGLKWERLKCHGGSHTFGFLGCQKKGGTGGWQRVDRPKTTGFDAVFCGEGNEEQRLK